METKGSRAGSSTWGKAGGEAPELSLPNLPPLEPGPTFAHGGGDSAAPSRANPRARDGTGGGKGTRRWETERDASVFSKSRIHTQK